jgi:hypothetical protein
LGGRRWITPLLILGCLAAVFVACYRRAIFDGEQFAYRDAAHYYYPLHQRVQAEWKVGRWPLWEPEENGGMPLLGNPTAAVLYPGKLVFALVRYPLAARLYIMGHTLLAFVAMLALLRNWRISWVGSSLGALAYAFGGPVLFQYCNIIYLVGAAWLPLGFRAVDAWLRLGRRRALVELAVVLALETLGGDPESAYLTGVCAGGYAASLAWRGQNRGFRVVPVAALLLVLWVAATLIMAYVAPTVRPVPAAAQPQPPLPWTPWVGPVVASAWVIGALVLVARWWRRRTLRDDARSRLVPMLGGSLWRRGWQPRSRPRRSCPCSSSSARAAVPRTTARTISTRSACTPCARSSWSGRESSAPRFVATGSGSASCHRMTPTSRYGRQRSTSAASH